MRGRHSTYVPSDLGYREGILLKLNSKGAGKKDPPLGSQALKSYVGSNRVKDC